MGLTAAQWALLSSRGGGDKAAEEPKRATETENVRLESLRHWPPLPVAAPQPLSHSVSRLIGSLALMCRCLCVCVSPATTTKASSDASATPQVLDRYLAQVLLAATENASISQAMQTTTEPVLRMPQSCIFHEKFDSSFS